MQPLRLLHHLHSIRSVPWKAASRRALTLVPDLLRGGGRSSALVNITLELTYRCNLTCEFCFLKDSVLHQKREELTLAEIERLADQARAFGASFFLTGGEPFLRRDLPEIIAAIKARGLKVGLNTNGLLVDEEAGARVREAGLDYAIFSLHGPRDVHDELENRKGAFDTILANLETFARAKKRTRLLANCVVAKENSGRLDELPPLLAHLPLDGLTFQHETFLTAEEVARNEEVWKVLFPDRPHPLVYESSGYGARDFAGLDRGMAAIGRQRKKLSFPVFFKPHLRGPRIREWYTKNMKLAGSCLYIWTDVRVEPDGVINACQVMPTPMGSLRESSLAEILNGPAYTEFRAKNREAGGLFPACARCCKLYRNPMNSITPRRTANEQAEGAEPSPTA